MLVLWQHTLSSCLYHFYISHHSHRHSFSRHLCGLAPSLPHTLTHTLTHSPNSHSHTPIPLLTLTSLSIMILYTFTPSHPHTLTQNELTGEHSCIMLRALGAESSGGWLAEYYNGWHSNFTVAVPACSLSLCLSSHRIIFLILNSGMIIYIVYLSRNCKNKVSFL